MAGADKPHLVVTPTPTTTGELEVRYDFVLETGADRRQAISAAY